MERAGIVDLGSNTVRLVVYDYEPGAWFRLTDEIRELVRLGEGLATTGMISERAMVRALAALRLYDDFAQARGVQRLEIIATSAVRDATNGRDFLALVCDLGLDIEVLAGDDEARLGVLAVANSFALNDAWVMDLGGGSAQISLMRDRHFVEGAAYPLGAVRLTDAYLPRDPPRVKDVRALEKAARKQLMPVIKRMRAQPYPLVAMGGTIRNLASAVQHLDGHPLDQVHNYHLGRGALDMIVEELMTTKPERRARISGIRDDRADVILAGALIYRLLLHETGLDGLLVSREGVRQGAFYRQFLSFPHLLDDVRGFSMQNIFAHYPQPLEHTQQVRFLARRLFEQLHPLHGYGPAEARLLDEAATLHDIGMMVGYYDHHKHGAYLINAAAMPGFSHREQALLGLIVRYARKGDPKPGEFSPLMRAGDDLLLRRLAACARLAAFLERSRSSHVQDIEVAIDAARVTLHLVATREAAVERWEAQRQGDLFRQAFGRDLVLAVP